MEKDSMAGDSGETPTIFKEYLSTFKTRDITIDHG